MNFLCGILVIRQDGGCSERFMAKSDDVRPKGRDGLCGASKSGPVWIVCLTLHKQKRNRWIIHSRVALKKALMLPKCRLSVPMRGRGRMPSFLGMRCCPWPPGSPVSLPSPAGGRRQTTSCLKCRAVKGAGAVDRCCEGLRSHRWAEHRIDRGKTRWRGGSGSSFEGPAGDV